MAIKEFLARVPALQGASPELMERLAKVAITRTLELGQGTTAQSHTQSKARARSRSTAA